MARKQNRVKVKESPITQGACESVPYALGYEGSTAPTSPSFIVFQGASDMTGCVMGDASPTATGSLVNLPNISNLEPDKAYDVITFAMLGARKQSAAFRIDTFDEKDV